MPFYKITIGLKKTEEQESRRSISVVREYRETDLDRIWHLINLKCEEKWGQKLNSFDCVKISKRSPDYKKYVRDKQQKIFNQYDDILSPDYIVLTPNKDPISDYNMQSVNGKYRNQKD